MGLPVSVAVLCSLLAVVGAAFAHAGTCTNAAATAARPRFNTPTLRLGSPSRNGQSSIDAERQQRSPGIANNFYDSSTDQFKRPKYVGGGGSPNAGGPEEHGMTGSTANPRGRYQGGGHEGGGYGSYMGRGRNGGGYPGSDYNHPGSYPPGGGYGQQPGSPRGGYGQQPGSPRGGYGQQPGSPRGGYGQQPGPYRQFDGPPPRRGGFGPQRGFDRPGPSDFGPPDGFGPPGRPMDFQGGAYPPGGDDLYEGGPYPLPGLDMYPRRGFPGAPPGYNRGANQGRQSLQSGPGLGGYMQMGGRRENADQRAVRRSQGMGDRYEPGFEDDPLLEQRMGRLEDKLDDVLRSLG